MILLGLLLGWALWQRFEWFKSLVKAIFTYGLGAFAICTVLLYGLLPFFDVWQAMYLGMIYVYGMPVVVFLVVIWGWRHLYAEAKAGVDGGRKKKKRVEA